jgi:peptide deformylase
LSILKVARLGTPLLRQVSKKVEKGLLRDGGLDGFFEDMEETLREYGGTGLAAPQVYTPIRVLLYEVTRAPRDRKTKEVPLTVLINPEVEVVDPELEIDWEACLSVPLLTGKVPRPRRIRVQALGAKGEDLEFLAEGFHARVILHELDHLDGVLYVDRADSRTLAYTVDL